MSRLRVLEQVLIFADLIVIVLRKLANLIYAFPKRPVFFNFHLKWPVRVTVNLEFLGGRTVSHEQVRLLRALNVHQCLAAATRRFDVKVLVQNVIFVCVVVRTLEKQPVFQPADLACLTV